MADNSHIEILLKESGAKPDSVRLRDLTFLLGHLETAVAATADRNASEVGICLTEIFESSAGYGLILTDEGWGAAATISDAINRRSSEKLPQVAVHSLNEIQKRISKLGHTFTLNNNSFTATILPSSPLFVDSLVFGATSIFAQVTAIGGQSPTAKLIVSGHGSIVAEIPSKEFAQKLSPYLYKNAVLEGDATWVASTMKLRNFRIKSIGDYSDDAGSNPTIVINSLRDFSAGVWDDVDPDTYVRDQRE